MDLPIPENCNKIKHHLNAQTNLCIRHRIIDTTYIYAVCIKIHAHWGMGMWLANICSSSLSFSLSNYSYTLLYRSHLTYIYRSHLTYPVSKYCSCHYTYILTIYQTLVGCMTENMILEQLSVYFSLIKTSAYQLIHWFSEFTILKCLHVTMAKKYLVNKAWCD